jgi:8-oxo-dGTP diphosphatase
MKGPPDRPVIGVGVVVIKATETGPLVLLIRRGKAPQAGAWSLPGGHQELGETLKEAARREVLEETAVTVQRPRLLDVIDAITRDAQGQVLHHYSLVDFLAVWRAGDVLAGSDAADARWVAPNELAGYSLWSETERMIALGLARFAAEELDDSTLGASASSISESE